MWEAARVAQPPGERWRAASAICALLPRDSLRKSGGMRLADALAQLILEMEEYGAPPTALLNDGGDDGNDADGSDGSGGGFSYEAELLAGVYYALGEDDADTDADNDNGKSKNEKRGKAFAETMDSLARSLPSQLLFLCDGDREPTPAQKRFLQLAPQAQVFRDSPAAEEQWLRAVLSADGCGDEAEAECDLRGRLRRCAEYPAATLADGAKTALAEVRRFLARREEGETLGVVVYDRLLARRLRALAEAEGILIADRGGWRAATLSCGAALSCAAENAARPFDAEESPLLLQPPFWGGLGENEHSDLQRQWREAAEAAPSPPADWGEVCAGKDCGELLKNAAAQLQNSADAKNQTKNAREWLQAARENGREFLRAYESDSAAAELWQRALACAGGGEMDAAGFCAWLDLFLQGEDFSGEEIESPVAFLPPGRGGCCERLLLLGANAETLPAAGEFVFGERARRALGLPSRGERTDWQRADFCRLLLGARELAAVWRDNAEHGAQIGASPFWRLFADELQRQGGTVTALPPPVPAPPAPGVVPPSPAAATVARLPASVRITSVDSLMQCPYQFFARAVLRLDDDEAENEMSPRTEGQILHSALRAWMENDGGGGKENAESWRAALAAAAEEHIRPRGKLAQFHWLGRSESLLRWQKERREEGWKTEACEFDVEEFLPLPFLNSARADGEETPGIRLRGRIDRRDTLGEQTTLIDYKRGGGADVSKIAFAAGEHPQLPLYAFLSREESAVLILCHPIAKSGENAAKELRANVRRIAARLRAAAKQIAAGKPLPANGAAEVCKKCEARRICRKDHWLASPPPPQ